MAAIVSERDGPWVLGTTWADGVVPTEGDTATISAGHTVTIYESNTIGNDSGNALTVNGILHVPSTDQIPGTTVLALKGNITFGSGGEFRIGESSSARLPSATVFQIQINYSASPSAREFTFTVPNNGKLLWYGAAKTTDTTHSGVTAGTDPTMTVGSATDWRIGDRIILVDETDRTKTEEFTIKTGYTSGSTTVPLSGTLANTKTTGWHVFNLTSNIQVVNYSNTYKSYMELLGTATNQHVLSHVMLNQLGDSTKSALRLGRSVLNLTEDNVINAYKCYKVEFTDLYGTDKIHTLQSYADANISLVTGGCLTIGKINSINPTSDHCSFGNATNISIGTLNMYGGAGHGLSPSTCMYVGIDTLLAIGINGSGKYAIYPTGTCDLRIGSATCKYGVYGISNVNIGNTYIKSFTSSDNTSGDIRNSATKAGGGVLAIESCSLTSTTPIVYNVDGGKILISKYNGTIGDSRIYSSNTMLQSENTIFRTAAPSIKCSLNNTLPLVFPLSGFCRTAYVTSGKIITLNCYSYKSASSTGAVTKLRIAKGNDGRGLSETADYNILPASTTTWTSQSHNLGTTTSAGFITIELVIEKGATTFDLYIDDLTFVES